MFGIPSSIEISMNMRCKLLLANLFLLLQEVRSLEEVNDYHIRDLDKIDHPLSPKVFMTFLFS